MTDLEAVRDAEARLRAAQLAGDTAALAALLDDDLSFIGPNGRRMHKADDLALHASGRIRFSRFDLEDEHLQPVGDCVVAMVRAQVAGVMDGESFTATGVWTRVWRRARDGWRLAAAHVSAFPT
jgi:ketosteroid isomerase-like protein